MRFDRQRARSEHDILAGITPECGYALGSQILLMSEAGLDQAANDVCDIVWMHHQIQVERRPQPGIGIGGMGQHGSFERHRSQTAVGQQVQHLCKLQFGASCFETKALATERQAFADVLAKFAPPTAEQCRGDEARDLVMACSREQRFQRR